VPDPDAMFHFGARWAYWVSWVGSLGAKAEPIAELRRRYGSRYVLDE
jgi:hypothetical protein